MTLGEHPRELLAVFPSSLRPILAHAVRHFVDREPVDREPCGRGLQDESTTGRDTVEVRGSAGLGDQRLDVLVLAF